MIPTLTVHQLRDVETALDLREREARLRAAARRAELVVGRHQEASDLFRRASGLRRLRIRLLERCGLL